MLTRLPRIAFIFLLVLGTTGCSINLFNTLGLSSSQIDVENLEEVVRANPDHAHAWFVLGREQYRNGNHGQARRSFGRAVAIQPGFVEAQLGIGLTYLEQERWRRAEQAFAKAAEWEGGAVRGNQGIAEARLGMGDFAGAEEHAQRALSINPQHAFSLRIMGDVRYVEGQYGEAARYWRDSVRFGGDDKRLVPLLEDLEDFLASYPEQP